MKKQAYMKFVLLIAAVFLLALGPVQAMAADKALSMDDAAAVLKNFDPSIQVKSVEPSSIDGLSEVIVIVKGEVGIVYIASDKKHVILGSIVDAATKNNITKARFEAVKAKYTPKVDFGAIPLDDAVVMGDPKAAHKVVVFDDPS